MLLSFNAAGLSTLNGGVGGVIAVGGQITSISGGTTQFAFSFTQDTSGLHRPTLTITTTSSSAPEPGTLALLALGMVGGVVARRRK
ncbi:PEP-CTERM sorting domain-containing protein [Armatimonas sp.]|uniref:PEP-CTERM sorting domain-containing protein n=1 Tax=Armatimonas sp. TaxID=1872638 RepID=UPI00374D7B30